jgi:hypothetical protein
VLLDIRQVLTSLLVLPFLKDMRFKYVVSLTSYQYVISCHLIRIFFNFLFLSFCHILPIRPENVSSKTSYNSLTFPIVCGAYNQCCYILNLKGLFGVQSWCPSPIRVWFKHHYCLVFVLVLFGSLPVVLCC